MTKPIRLPKPDEYGNYWLDKPACAPAILRGGDHVVLAEGTKDEREILRREHGQPDERYFLSLESGIVFEGRDIRYFLSARDALGYAKLNGLLAPQSQAETTAAAVERSA